MFDTITYVRLYCDCDAAIFNLRIFNPSLTKWDEKNNHQHWAKFEFLSMLQNKMTLVLTMSFNAWVQVEWRHMVCSFFIKHMDQGFNMLFKHKNEIKKLNGEIGPK